MRARSLLFAVLWVVAASAAHSASDLPRKEISRQTELLKKRVDAFSTDASGRRFFFIGAALGNDTPAFRNEIELAQKVFDAKWGTAGRSLVLVNPRKARRGELLATPENLFDAVRMVSDRMDPASDVLVLALSSHGFRRPAPGLLVSVPGIKPTRLPPDYVKQALDTYGIRWRVVIVSACYAGTFLDELADASSAVVTAADATHRSFGCGEKDQLTYFGRAFYK
jgi:hypothetical protein